VLSLLVALLWAAAGSAAAAPDDPPLPPGTSDSGMSDPGMAEPAMADASGSDDAESKAEAAAAAALVTRMKSTEVADKKAAAQEAATNASPTLTPALVHLLGDADSEVRLATIAALRTRTDAAGKRSAASSLAARIAKLSAKAESRAELDATIAALHDLAQTVSIKPLLDGVEPEIDPEMLKARLMAVANVPAAEAIEALISFASRGRHGLEGWRRLTTAALRSATGQELGHDPDVWRAWWRDHEKDFDYGAAAAARREGSTPRRGGKKNPPPK
jgi:hypothetical protein